MRDRAPRHRIEQACAAFGREVVVSRCLELLAGAAIDDESFLVVLGGRPARGLLLKGVPPEEAYWVRVWAARGLLWAGPGEDVTVLRRSLADDSWRVREMVCKVVARHLVADLLADVADLDTDPVPRVRAAAKRAVARIVDAQA